MDCADEGGEEESGAVASRAGLGRLVSRPVPLRSLSHLTPPYRQPEREEHEGIYYSSVLGPPGRAPRNPGSSQRRM
jgi:hypothetical protein